MRYLPLALPVALAACTTGEDLRTRHGSPLYTHHCDNGKSYQSRQLMTGEVEVTAGGQTRDAIDANGDPIPGGPLLVYADSRTTLTGMPGGPYENCALDETS